MSTGVVVSSILLARDQLLRVVELAVGTSSDLVKWSRLKIDKDSTRNMFASTSLREKGVERIVTTADGLVGRHLTIWLDAVLKAVELPAAIAHLDSGLTDMKGKNFSHLGLIDLVSKGINKIN